MPGTYEIIYRVTNSKGNSIEVKRFVKVKLTKDFTYKEEYNNIDNKTLGWGTNNKKDGNRPNTDVSNEELKKYKSDDGKIWCRFIKINKYYDQTHGNFYEFTNTDLDEYTNEFGVILEHTKTSFYNTYEYNYIYNNGCLTRMDYFFEDFKQFYMPINKKIDDDYIAFINESVDKLKERSQKQNGPRLVKKID